MSYTIWSYQHDNAPHHDNELNVNTYDSLSEAAKVARQLVSETHHNTGYAKIIDNDIRGKMGDSGLMAIFTKDKNGRVFSSAVREGFEDEIRAKIAKIRRP